MTTYAIGDVQGCFSELMQLLELINFDSQHDVLWFTGDLVNRGPQSLETLRFIKNLNHQQICILGNHDIHLLAVAYGVRSLTKNDTLESILSAPDKINLIEWLRHQPILHFDDAVQTVMVHAGIAPVWTLDKAKILAAELAQALQSDNATFILKNIFGNDPSAWNDELEGMERLRCIANYFTRMRFCDEDGALNLSYKGNISDAPTSLLPWFLVPNRVVVNEKIIFGHWAALNGEIMKPNIFPLDTGCVWGNCLTALRLEDDAFFSVKCRPQ